MTPCTIWTKYVAETGYGQLRRDGVLLYAHREAWEQAHGPVPPGHDVHHVCGTRACVNVAHLHLVAHDHHPRLHPRPKPVACKRGHNFTPTNTIVHRDGRWECRTCRRATQAA